MLPGPPASGHTGASAGNWPEVNEESWGSKPKPKLKGFFLGKSLLEETPCDKVSLFIG